MIKDFQTWANENDAHLKQSRLQSQQMNLVNWKAQWDGEPFIAFSQRSYNIWKIAEAKKPETEQEKKTLPPHVPNVEAEAELSLWDFKVCVDWSFFVWLYDSKKFYDKTDDSISIIDFNVIRKDIVIKLWDSIEITKDIIKLYIKDTQDVGLIDVSDTMQVIKDITKEEYIVGTFAIKKDIVEENFNPLTYKEW